MQEVLSKALKASLSYLKDIEIEHIRVISKNLTIKTWCLELKTGQKVFAKTGAKEDFKRLQFEAEGLSELNKFAEKKFLYIPTPLIVKQFENSSVLLIPWINFTTGSQELLGKGLAMLHKSSSENNSGRFGWDQDGYIGLGPQEGGWKTSWGE